MNDPLAFDPDHRLVRLPLRVISKVLRGQPEMDGHVEEILETVAQPDRREVDPYGPSRRERYFRSGVGPRRWLRVVVEYGEGDSPSEGIVVTAFGQDEDPE